MSNQASKTPPLLDPLGDTFLPYILLLLNYFILPFYTGATRSNKEQNFPVDAYMLEHIVLQLPQPGLTFGLAVFAIFAVANLKSLPLVYTFRVLPSFYRLLRPRLLGVAKETLSSSSSPLSQASAALPALFRYHTSTERAIILDLDINFHKSNSTFFSDADINRATLLSSLLGVALSEAGPATFILAATSCKFRREIRPLQTYSVSSRILAWDDKSMWVVTYFLSPSLVLGKLEATHGLYDLLQDESVRDGLYAIMISRYVFKAKRKTLPPSRILKTAGLLISESEARGAEKLLDMSEVEDAMRSGFKYVKECML